MKRAVSISIGSSKRDKAVEINLLGESVSIERIGTNGDMEKAAQLYRQMDGVVDAFGVGGTDLGVMVDHHFYPLYSIHSMVRFVKQTPMVDGNGLKQTLERRCAQVLEEKIDPWLKTQPKTAFLCAATDRWGMAQSFGQAGYDCVYGDMMFALGMPFPLRSENSVKILAALLMPIAGRLPFKWIYPTGESQDKRTPKWERWFQEATVIAGDCHYITRYMPDLLKDKVVVTNTTTQDDVTLFRNAGVKYMLTTTPVLDGRSFGTNMMEAALIAASGRRQPVDYRHADSYLAELNTLLEKISLEPQLQELN